MKHKKILAILSLASVVGMTVAEPARADAIITSGNGLVTVGVKTTGELGNDNGGAYTGIDLVGLGDGITPGCLCEGWGVSANGVAGWRANSAGNSNIGFTSAGFVGSNYVSRTYLSSLTGLTVSQSFGTSLSGSLIKNHVTITNTAGATVTDVRYARAMDWDVPPTPFNELVTIGGVGATALTFSNDNGFSVPNPLTTPSAIMAGTTNTNFTDNGPADHGAFFVFSFGDLASGMSKEFDVFYGATGDQASALAALGKVGAEVYSLGQSNGHGDTGAPGTYIFGFTGVGGTPLKTGDVPEPTSLALFGLGLAGATLMRRKNSKTVL
jgi:type IV pilus assembly protein PilY1